MPNGAETNTRGLARAGSTTLAATGTDRARQAFNILYLAFVAAPAIAGLDKFFHLLVNWHMYLSPELARLSPIGAEGLMLVVGVVEVVAALIVAIKPRVGAYVVAVWLAAIILNLLLLGRHYDIALRDFGLLLGALALARLAGAFERPGGRALR